MVNIKTGLISVLVLTCNSSRFIGEALQSLLEQTYTNWEALVIDDGSTDDSVDIVMRYVAHDSRIHFLGANQSRQGQNGIGALRNRCLLAAWGEFVAVLDSDDMRYPRSFEVSMKIFADMLGFSVVSTQYNEVDAYGRLINHSACLGARRRITEEVPLMPLDITQLILKSGGGRACPIAPSATVLRKAVIDAIGGYNEKWRFHTDSNLYRRLAHFESARFCIVKDVLSAYRVHGTQRSRIKHLEGWIEPTELS